jgi:hypothetical protein
MGATAVRADEASTEAAAGLVGRAHVRWNDAGTATAVDYAGFARDRAALDAYRAALAAVTEADFATWPTADRLAFLVNAYNANTIALVLTRYPDLKSIKDLGGWITSPWKERFFELLGTTRSLDDVEHGLIRGGVADRPRALRAQLRVDGCPALAAGGVSRRRARRAAARPDRALPLRPHRNRWTRRSGSLEVSQIFEWYGRDFERAAGTVAKFLAAYAPQLSDDETSRGRIAAAALPVAFLDYGWRLNDAGRTP